MLHFFELVEKLQIDMHISNVQNMYYEMFCLDFEKFFAEVNEKNGKDTRKLLLALIEIGRKLNINMDFYLSKIDSLTGKV